MAVIWYVVGFSCLAGLFMLGRRWTRPRPVASDLRRADEAEAKDSDPKTMRERVMNYTTMFGPNNT